MGDYLFVASLYVADAGKILLVHHRGFDMWVPPGGHVEGGERLSQAALREGLEETGLDIELISAVPAIHVDENSSPEPVPFYCDILREGFEKPALTHYYWGRLIEGSRAELRPQYEELRAAKWITSGESESLHTFEQVRAMVRYAFANHPALRECH